MKRDEENQEGQQSPNEYGKRKNEVASRRTTKLELNQINIGKEGGMERRSNTHTTENADEEKQERGETRKRRESMKSGGGLQEPQYEGKTQRRHGGDREKNTDDNINETENGAEGGACEDAARGGGSRIRVKPQVDWTTHYGDKRDKRKGEAAETDTIRFGTYNINTFPKLGSLRSRRLRQELHDFDCIGMSELNKNWYKINAQDSFRRRIDGWWNRHKTRHTWLRDFDWATEYQQGGVSISTIGTLSDYSQERGEDPSGLGRWCWQKLEGHSNTKTAVFQIYRPVRNTQDYGSTYIQQRTTAGIFDPIAIFDKDLLEQVDQFTAEDFQIVIMGDFNVPLNARGTLERELGDRGIREVILARYGKQHAPNTHVRGTKPIDGIFASESIQMVKGGYEEGMSDISDHRLVWADLAIDTVLGVDRGEMVSFRT